LRNQKEELIVSIKDLLRKGQYFAAHNVADKALSLYPSSKRIRKFLGLTLAKLGFTNKAMSFLLTSYQLNQKDAENAGALGRVMKDQFKSTGDIEKARTSRNIYLENYQLTGSYYTGINAAAMSYIIGDKKRANKIATNILDDLRKKRKGFWELVTLGEANLLMGQKDLAFEYYEKARSLVKKDFGMINSVYTQLKFISRFLEVPDQFLSLYGPPSIVAFTGHMIDYPGSKTPRFPDYIEKEVAREIRRILEEKNAQIGYCSLACGGDILFAEAMIERGAEINIFLPYAKNDFIETSVRFAGNDWVERFNKIFRSHTVKFITEEDYFGTHDLFSFLGKVLFGHCMLRANFFMTEPTLLTVLSKETNKAIKAGGTQYLVEQWPFRENLIRIDPTEFIYDKNSNPSRNKPVIFQRKIENHKKSLKRSIRHIMFADIVGYSKLGELERLVFIEKFLFHVSTEIKKHKLRLELINTWGDSIYAVAKDINHIMKLSFILHKAISLTAAKKNKLMPEISIRIALHAGPVFLGYDPLIKKKSASGSHVIRAARMEPVTIPGTIYASEQFASCLMADNWGKYRFDHVGLINLPKGFGEQEIYQITRLY
jgi:tetratricopeptide (TPR) repeat protein